METDLEEMLKERIEARKNKPEGEENEDGKKLTEDIEAELAAVEDEEERDVLRAMFELF
jgi:hypothetical protein